MKYTATRALQNFLSNKFLNSLSLYIVGGMLDLLDSAVSQALERQTVLKSLYLHLVGPLSCSSASFLEKGLMENGSLNYIRLCVHDELPGNWHSVVENLRLAKKSPVCYSIYPNTFNNVANDCFRPVLVRKGLKQHLTVNVWGEMKCEAAEALCEVLAPSSITVLTLNVHGNLTSEVSNSIARCLEENKTLSSLSINLWGELTTKRGIVPSSPSKTVAFSPTLSLDDGEDNQENCLTPSILSNVLAAIKSLSTLSVANIHSVSMASFWTEVVCDCLREYTSLKKLS